jgi:ADP-ribose pyrophosphatase YjhB (NUDIX family)
VSGARVARRRIAARVVLLDPDDRVLLMRYAWPLSGRRFWTTPGGGLRPGETYERAVAREIVEETGLTGLAVGPAVWQRRAEFDWGHERLLVHERFFLARVPRVELGADLVAAHRREGILEHRWWTPAELAEPAETIYPAGFPALLRALLSDGPPAVPLRLVEDD